MISLNFKPLALSLSVLLAACGGGGDSGEPTAAAPAAACVNHTITVALLGDSTQWGSDGSPGYKAPNAPAAALQASMDRQFGIGAVSVLDRAVGGTTALQAPSVTADIVVANYGINDAAPWGESMVAYRAALMALPVTIFETPNPTPGQPSWDLADRAQTMREVAALRGIPVADVFAYVSALPNFDAYYADGIHPVNELYGLISTNVLVPAVTRQVVALRCP